MIYFDPTETREGSLFADLKEIGGRPLQGLESATGADVLVTCAKGELSGTVNRPPGSLLLERFVRKGMLVQRKSGGDMLNSIPELGNILQRMVRWNCPSWLLVIGIFERSRNDKTMINGALTGWHYNALQGAWDAWQMQGGYIHWEKDHESALGWLQRWDKKLPEVMEKPEVFLLHRPAREVIGGVIDKTPWRATLASFPQCGNELSKVIADYCGSLASSLAWMTYDKDYGLAGIGLKRKAMWRQWLGLQEEEFLYIGGTPERERVLENDHQEDRD